MNPLKETAMPPKGRTNTDTKARKKSKTPTDSPTQLTVSDAAAAVPETVKVEGHLDRRGWRKKQVNVWLPPIPRGSALGVGAGSTWLAYSLIAENTAGTSTWPTITLVGMGMAYDLGLRLIDRWR